ncbi:hypothetical protein NE865_05880 [Phthorimaea operculella]|nr:hypothetical protein NE865_05880 [Phthorimaea operculella]
MDTLKRKRTQLRRNYTALNKKFVAAVEGNKDVEAKFLALSEAAEALFDVEDKVYEAWSESADFVEADFEADQNKALEYRESWAEARTIYNDLRPKQLSRHSSQTSVNSHTAKYDEVDDELAMLMSFLKSEVESEERISLARQGFSHDDISPPTACFVAGTSKKTDDKMFSATNFTKQCIWCDKDTHSSAECSKATRMTAKERIELAKSKKACLICLKIHVSKECKAHPKCLFCSKRHVTLLCQEIPERTEMSKSENSSSNSDSSNELLCQQSSTTLLKTLAVDLIAGNKEVRVRAFIDPGAQKSYIKKDLAIKLGLKPVRVEKLSHNLFGGVKTSTEEHPVYDVCLKSTCDEFSINLSVLGKEKICGILPKVRSDTLKEHLRLKGIKLTESRDTPDEVTLLIGADFSGKLRTGEFVQFDNHLFAVQTKLGWTIEAPFKANFITFQYFSSWFGGVQ